MKAASNAIRLDEPGPQIRAWCGFVLTIAGIGMVWLIVLPMVESQPSVSEHIANQKRLGVDPSAMFYTELKIAPEIANHVERLHDAHSKSFWNVGHQTIEKAKAQSE
jgi:hypothetical protein